MGAITVAYADKLKGLAFKATTTLTRAVDSPVAEAPVSIEANDLAKFREEVMQVHVIFNWTRLEESGSSSREVVHWLHLISI